LHEPLSAIKDRLQQRGQEFLVLTSTPLLGLFLAPLASFVIGLAVLTCGRMLTYREAADAVRAALAEDWDDSLDIALHGYEDADAYRVPVFERGPIFTNGGPAYPVDKLNGVVSTVSIVGERDRLNAMTSTEVTP